MILDVGLIGSVGFSKATSRVEWSGVEWSGVEWSGVAGRWSGVEWSDWTVEWSDWTVTGLWRGGAWPAPAKNISAL